MELGLSQKKKTILVLRTFTKQFKEILIVEKDNGALIFILIYQLDNTF